VVHDPPPLLPASLALGDGPPSRIIPRMSRAWANSASARVDGSDLLIRSCPYRRPVPYGLVHDLGRVSSGCPAGSEASEGCSSVWLPAWLPARAAPRPLPAVFKSVRNSCPAALLPGLSAAVPTCHPRSSRVYPARSQLLCITPPSEVGAAALLLTLLPGECCVPLGTPGWFMRTSVIVAQIQRSPSARTTAMRWCPSST
jgi:hypothetical protein